MIDPMLPGADLVERGIDDLRNGKVSAGALLVSIAEPRLRSLGLDMPAPLPDPELRLYALLQEEHEDDAHGRYNALIRRLVSFENAAECARQSTRRVSRPFFAPSGRRRDALLRAIPRLKEDLRINVELASPDDFIPVPAGWEDRSIFIVQHGPVAFFHFDLTAQALSKVERGHARDLEDVRQMLARGLVTASGLRETFELIAPHLYRFPAIDPRAFRERLDALLSNPAVSGGP